MPRNSHLSCRNLIHRFHNRIMFTQLPTTRRAEIFPAKPAQPPTTSAKPFVAVAQQTITTTKPPQSKHHANAKQKGTNLGNQNLATSQRSGGDLVFPNHIANENEIIGGEGLVKGMLYMKSKNKIDHLVD